MFDIKKIPTDTNILILQYLDRTDFTKVRGTSKYMLNICNHDIFWRVINLSGVTTIDQEVLYRSYKNERVLTIYNLSQKAISLVNIPIGIVQQLTNTRLLII